MILIVILSCVFLCVLFGAFVAVIIFYDDDLQSRKVTRGRGNREKMPGSPSRRRSR